MARSRQTGTRAEKEAAALAAWTRRQAVFARAARRLAAAALALAELTERAEWPAARAGLVRAEWREAVRVLRYAIDRLSTRLDMRARRQDHP